MADFSYETRWFADAVVEHDAVLRASVLSNRHVRVERKDLAPITVAPLDTPRIDIDVAESVLASCVPTVILLIAPTSHYDWNARVTAEASGSTIHTFSELYTFMDEPDLRPFVDKHVSYLRNLLETHSKVTAVEMICEASMLVKRRGRLSEMIAAIEYEYEFGEAALVRALKYHPDAQMVINANPNGGSTNGAQAHAEAAGVAILSIKEAMGALNFGGASFREYVDRGWR